MRTPCSSLLHSDGERKPGNNAPLVGVHSLTMVRVRYRWLVPIGHLLVDIAALLVWIHHQDQFYTPRTRLVTPVLFQEAGAPGWDFRYPPAPEYLFIALGNTPAGLISGALRQRSSPGDPVWLLLHEVFASLVWLGAGVFADGAHRRFARVMLFYLAARVLGAAFLAFELLVRVELLFWLGLTLWFVVWAVRRLTSLRFARAS